MKFKYKKKKNRVIYLTKPKRISYHIISAVLIIASLVIIPLNFMDVLKRTVSALTDFGTSIGFYVAECICLFIRGENWVDPTVTQIPDSAISLLPWEWDEFVQLFKTFLHRLIEIENIKTFLGKVSNFLVTTSKLLLPLLLIVIILVLLKVIIGAKVEKEEGDSVPLKIWKKLYSKIVRHVVKYISDYKKFLSAGRYRLYTAALALIWCIGLNVATIAIEILAFLFYFAISFDFKSIYIQVAKLFFDTAFIFDALPTVVSIALGLFIFDKIRLRAGGKKLKKLEKKDLEFLDTLSTSFLISGTMKAGKTLMLAFMLILWQKKMKEDSLKGLYRNAMRFPNFPYVRLERKITDLMQKHKIFTKYHCRRMIEVNRLYLKYSGDDSIAGKRLAREFMKIEDGVGEDEFDFIDEDFFGYDFSKVVYNNGLQGLDIFKCLSYYAEFFYIYSFDAPELLTNFSLEWNFRCDNDGNFPLWDLDLINSQTLTLDINKRYTKILNMDMLRYGRVMDPTDDSRHCFEFGGVGINEIDKERGNQFVTRGQKRDAEECNQSNDDFPLHERLKRHGATVENDNFTITGGDLQRTEDLGANHTGISDDLHVRSSVFKIELPFFHFEQLIYDLLTKYHLDSYFNDRYYHANDTLTRHILSFPVSRFLNFMEKRRNHFGVRYQMLDVHRQGAHEGDKAQHEKFPILASVVYGTYRTDAFNGITEEKIKRAHSGLPDMREFKQDAATWDDMQIFRSFMVQNLDKAFITIDDRVEKKKTPSPYGFKCDIPYSD